MYSARHKFLLANVYKRMVLVKLFFVHPIFLHGGYKVKSKGAVYYEKNIRAERDRNRLLGILSTV